MTTSWTANHLTAAPAADTAVISDAASGLQRATRLDTPRPTAPGVNASLAALNRVREAAGVGPVRLNATMSAFAAGWCEEMSRSEFRHSGGPYAENIAWTSDGSLSADAAAVVFNDLWVDSSGHYSNMIDPAHTDVGIGLFRGPTGWYATHVFT